MTHTVQLHLFTNSTSYAPLTETIEETYESFVQTFDPNKEVCVSVWCDSNPNVQKAGKYKNRLMGLFGTNNVHTTRSLSDGYVQAINQSKADVLFMLEHDWVFRTENIEHSLFDIAHTILDNDHFIHMRFNRRRNIIRGSDHWLDERKSSDMSYCITPSMSNNPHLIHRERYKALALPHIKVQKGAKGIEGTLNRINTINGALYGGKDHPPTVRHTNGRGDERTFERQLRRERKLRQRIT